MTNALQQQIAELAEVLTQQQLKLATAESCTGGGIATACTDLAGSSAWFDCGFVTYSNHAKTQMLHVPMHLIEDQGAVSEAVVLAMVKGALKNSQANLAIAVSGIAGPGGGSTHKPVGTVWLAWGNEAQQHARCFHLAGNRQQVREQAVLHAIEALTTFARSTFLPS